MGVDARGDGVLLSRSELELELAALALAARRGAQERQRRPRAAQALLAASVEGFIAASMRLLERAHRMHRSWLIARLAEIASSSDLGIIGFEDWIATQQPQAHAASDRQDAAHARAVAD